MHSSLSSAWFESIRSYEGYTNWLYFDTHNPPLATTGVGNMIDSGKSITKFGLSLPWRFKDGQYANETDILNEYDRLKDLNISNQGGFAYERHATLFLDEDVVKWLVDLKTEEFWIILKKTFPKIEEWPADAQLAILNMAWWMGPNFTSRWPNLTRFLKNENFLEASKNCTTVNPSRRNPDNVRRFVNAAKVKFAGLNVGTLWDDKVVYINSATKTEALEKVSAQSVASAEETVFNIDVWYVQRMLTIKSFYFGPYNGLRTKEVNASLRAWAKSQGISYKSNVETLSKLSAGSVDIPIVD